MRNIIVVDIETMPNRDMINLLPEVEASKVLKDEEKIKKDIEEKKLKQIEDMALSPLYGMIACIGYSDGEEKGVLIGDESTVLNDFFNLVNGRQIITYNGINFDIPFIFKRACKHGISTIKQMENYIKKFDDFNHIDLMQKFCEYGKYEKLNTLAKIYLGETKIDFDVKLIPDFIKTEEGKKQLSEYCLKDVELTYNLAKKFGYIYEKVEDEINF